MKKDYIYIGLIIIAIIAYIFKPKDPVVANDLTALKQAVIRSYIYKDSIYKAKNVENLALTRKIDSLSRTNKKEQVKININTKAIFALSDSSLVKYVDSLRIIGIK